MLPALDLLPSFPKVYLWA